MTVADEESRYGLGKDWKKVQQVLEEVIPVYDKTNRYISLGTDLKLRKRGIDILVDSLGIEDFASLDLGSGTGRMALELGQRAPNAKDSIVLLDPISKMARLAKSMTHNDPVIAVFEHLPFKVESFEAATAGFAIRDACDLKAALVEINGILKQGGKFLVVDLAKPDSRIKSGLLMLYWRLHAPLIAFLSSGRLGLKFGALAKTFRRLPRISEFLSLIRSSGFKVARTEFYMMGGSCILLLEKILDA